MNLAEGFDWIRRSVGVVPPIDRGVGDAGEEPSWQPFPSNALLSQAVDHACRIINREIGLGEGPEVISISVGVQTVSPYVMSLGNVPLMARGSVTTVRRVWWENELLRSTTLYKETQQRRNYIDEAVGTPVDYAVEDYKLYIMPAPSAAGTLKLMVGAAVLGPKGLRDGFHGLPSAYETVPLSIASAMVAGILASDAEMIARKPNLDAMAAAELDSLREWAAFKDEAGPGGFEFDAYHRPTASGRMR